MPQAIGNAFWQTIFQLGANFVISKFTEPVTIGARARLREIAAQRRRAIDSNYTGGVEPRRKLYGDFRASGLDVLPSVVTGPTGTRLHRVVVLSDGEIESIDAYNFNSDRILDSDVALGIIGTGDYAGKAQIFPHLGTNPQSTDTHAMAAPGWSEFHRGNGIAYVYVFYDFYPDVFKGGVPQLVVEGQGAIIYDPRLDITPGASPTNASYIAFSKNPALQLADYITWYAGGAEDSANVDWDDVVAAANICDEDVAIPGSTTEKRYTSSIDVYAPQSLAERDQTIQMLARAMLGICWFAGGKWRMRAGAYTSPVGSITDVDLLDDDIDIATAKPRSSGGAFNTVRGTYVEPLERTQQKGTPEVSSPAFVTEDGETIYGDLEFRTCRSVYEAERNEIQEMRKSRRRISVSGLFKFRVWKFELWDVVTCTLSDVGWLNQPARITRIRCLQNFTVELDLEEIASADFDDPDIADYETPSAVAPPESTDYVPNAPQNLSATSQASAIIFEWDPPANAPVGVLYRLYEYTSSTPFSSATQVAPDTAQNSIVLPKADTTIRYYWITAVDPVTGAESTQAPPTNGVPAGAATASSALGAIVTPGSATADGYTSSLTTNTVTVTPTGGTPGYTYATTFTSGGAGITTNNGTTASPSWSATGLSEGETRSGTARIRVTDSAGSPAQFDVYVAVTITRQYGVTLHALELVNSTGGSLSAAVSTFGVSSDGNVYPSPGISYQWKNPSASAADYDVRFTLNSGTLNSGTTGTWMQLSTTRVITGVRTPGQGAGTSAQNVTVEIRLHNSPFTVLATGTVEMNETI
jgi:hypothetical protein